MLRLFGVRLPTPVRALIGAALIALGIAAHRPVLALAGGIVLAWGVVGLVSAASTARRDGRGR